MKTELQNKEDIIETNTREDDERWPSPKQEMKTLRTELEQVKETMLELQIDYSNIQTEYTKQINKQQKCSNMIVRWKKIKNILFLNGKVEAEDESRKARNNQQKGQHTSQKKKIIHILSDKLNNSKIRTHEHKPCTVILYSHAYFNIQDVLHTKHLNYVPT
jgi:hypothetical protein